MPHRALTSVPVHPLLAERWSPRSFDPAHTLGGGQLASLLEAARWAASAFNVQPWRFLVGRRGDATFKAVHGALVGFNQRWAGDASVLIVAVAAESGADGAPVPTAAYDTGLAAAQLTTQAHAEGLHAHQMSGFDAGRLATAFGIPDGFRPLAVIAVGAVADPERLDDSLRARETAPRHRRPLDESFFSGAWGEPVDLRPA
ncbi:nitroreductase family protein [Streptomyces sp. MI02-7b]|uniref:nitroreductase family protein n=1 Tax=Streptomyces sp. MI02-7b TaxID=462941 RepID=UPI0029A2987C|nr:nitroreductase family protein [Streptomyces sp. MI02-7b]MDX3071570.1 nitroreductase family protein [Streptomyces sp. MI02-7b]